MGGMVITQAAAQRPDALAGLVYVTAFLPQPGQALIDITQLPEAAGDSVQANIVVEGDPPVATMPSEAAPEALYHCCTPEQIEWALPRRERQPVIPFTQPFVAGDDTAAFDALPRAYVRCLQDRAIRPPLQSLMSAGAGCDPVIEIDTDHSPWLSRTDELVAALDAIAHVLA
jgi:pimeloyl-ACP methyl ester carboxylesterase